MPPSRHLTALLGITLSLGVSASCAKTKATTGTGGQHPTTAGSGGGSSGGGSGGGAGSGGGSASSSGGGGAAPTCGTSAWSTYGHDPQRTSASDGCITGALTMLWSYTPAPPTGRTTNDLFQPLATSTVAYLHWSASDNPYTGTSAEDAVDMTGMRTWTFDSGTDTELGDWGSLWNDLFALQSDGVYLLDLTTGHKVATTGVDWWGQTLPGPSALFLVDTGKGDGPGDFVAALDATAKVLWQQNKQGTMCSEAFADQTGGLALDGSTLFYAPHYATLSGATTFASGVYAFNTAAMGAPLWNVATTPVSAISAGGGLLFLVEGSAGMTELVARKQTDGLIAWSMSVPGAGVQAPVLAAGKVLVAGTAGVIAVDQADGKPAWTSAVQATTAPDQHPISFGCGTVLPMANLRDTSIAVAAGSGTAVVAQGVNLTLVSLATGATLWTAAQPVTGSLGSPVIVGNHLYVVEHNGPAGRLLAYEGPP